MSASIHIPYASRLQDYVTAVWEVKGQHNVRETILPQGVVEIIFNFADSVSGDLPFGNTLMQAPRCFIQGMFTQVMHAEYAGHHHLLGIRLHPHRVRAMLDILPSELNNVTVDLTLIRPEFNTLWHQLAELTSFSEKALLIESELPDLSDRVCERSKTLSDLFLTETTEGFRSVDELAKQVCYSPRQLNRVVQDLYGVSAEELTTYKKFLQSVKLIHVETLSLTDVAYTSGFYDQSHFCRVFKSYTGMTPNQYKKQKGDQPFHIIS
jgi:AraC-like DNA-binding protein